MFPPVVLLGVAGVAGLLEAAAELGTTGRTVGWFNAAFLESLAEAATFNFGEAIWALIFPLLSDFEFSLLPKAAACN